MTLLACLLTTVFTALALLHVYWAAGGRRGAAVAIPTKPDGQPLFQTRGTRGALACLAVAVFLGAFGHLCLAHVELAPQFFLAGHTDTALFVVAGLFALRTLGDGRYVGLFRRVHGTDFARHDRRLYTPFCALLALGLAALALLG